MTWTFCTPAAIYPRTARAQAPAAVGRRHVLPERRLASSRLSAPGGRAAPAHRTLVGPPDTYTTLIDRPGRGRLFVGAWAICSVNGRDLRPSGPEDPFRSAVAVVGGPGSTIAASPMTRETSRRSRIHAL